jgi:hypothetical protein
MTVAWTFSEKQSRHGKITEQLNTGADCKVSVIDKDSGTE